MNTIRVSTFKDSHDSFMLALDDANVSYSEVLEFSQAPVMASGFTGTIQAISEAMPWNALAKVIVAWLEARASREVIITLNTNVIVHAKGYSMQDVEGALEKAVNLAVIDTKPENEDT